MCYAHDIFILKIEYSNMKLCAPIQKMLQKWQTLCSLPKYTFLFIVYIFTQFQCLTHFFFFNTNYIDDENKKGSYGRNHHDNSLLQQKEVLFPM